MATVSNRRMLVHTKTNGGWNTEEFATISDAMRSLRGRGLHFTDENVFFHPEFYGVIISDGVLVEVEESCNDGTIMFMGQEYMAFKLWAERENVPHWSARNFIYSGKLKAIRVGRLGLIYVLSSEKWKGRRRDGSYMMDGKEYIPLSEWARMNNISRATARRMISDGRLPYRWCGKRIVVDKSNKGSGYGKKRRDNA